MWSAFITYFWLKIGLPTATGRKVAYNTGAGISQIDAVGEFTFRLRAPGKVAFS